MSDDAIPVLTLWQPWASLVALGVKTIETRSWGTKYRGPFAIHASARKARVEDMKRVVGDSAMAWNAWHDAGLVSTNGETDHMPYGAIVATCKLVDCCSIGDPESFSAGLVEGEEPDVMIYYPPVLDWSPEALVLDRWNGPNIYVSDQLPFGDFTPGRWAWLLSDVELLDKPVPFKGGQGFTKRWKP